MKHSTFHSRSLIVVLFLTGLTVVASAGPLTVSVFTSIAPDPFLSQPTFLIWSANALTALRQGTTTQGTPGTPAFFSEVSSVTATDLIGTSFPSWLGQANPAAPFNTQTGNILMFPMTVFGTGQLFSMNEITFTDSFFGTPSTRLLSTVGYGARMVGINYGPDRIAGTADDIVFNGTGLTPGTSSNLVNALFFSGFGDQFFVSNPANLPASIAQIAAASTPVASGTTAVQTPTGTFVGSASVQVVPEPATLSLGAIGVLLLGFVAKRKR
jgi:PEP-CTERM motif